MSTVDTLMRALRSAPAAMLTADEAKVLDDAIVSLEALASMEGRDSLVAVVGPSGVGKSYLVNLLAGEEASATGVVRPTTGAPVFVGSPPPEGLEGVHVPAAGLPRSVTVVDTPAWEHRRRVVEAVLSLADGVVLVLSPARYADRTVAELVGALPAVPRLVILNRLDVQGPARTELIRDVERTFAPFLSVDEGDTEVLGHGWRDFAASLPPRDGARLRVLRVSAASGARRIAGAVTERSIELGSLASIVEGVDPPAVDAVRSVGPGWEATLADLVDSVDAAHRRFDEAVLSAAEGDMTERVHARLPRWDQSVFEAGADRWRQGVEATFTDRAKVRWRRSAAVALISRSAWRVGVNPRAPVPARLRRVMGERLDPTIAESAASLDRLIADAVGERMRVWREAVAEMGAYAPGELLAAADRLVEDGRG